MEEYWLPDGQARLIKEAFDRLRNRDSQRVDATDLIDFHGLFVKSFKFKVPIHPKNLSQLVHPHWGYMASMPNRAYTWDEMLAMYEIQMIASYEKAMRNDIHAEELSALSFWLTADTERKGHLEEETMSDLFHGLRFPGLKTWQNFRSEFSHSIPS